MSSSSSSSLDRLQAALAPLVTSANDPSVARDMFAACVRAVRPLLQPGEAATAEVTVLDTGVCRLLGRATNMAAFVALLLQMGPAELRVHVMSCSGSMRAEMFLAKVAACVDAADILHEKDSETLTLARGTRLRVTSLRTRGGSSDNVLFFLDRMTHEDLLVYAIPLVCAAHPSTRIVFVHQGVYEQDEEAEEYTKAVDLAAAFRGCQIVACACTCRVHTPRIYDAICANMRM